MFKKKFIFVLIVLILTGCFSLRPSPVTTIRLSGWQSSPQEQQQLQQVLKYFEKNHPQIRVNYEVIADQYMDVIKTRLIGDSAADIFYLDALEAPFFMRLGVLEPLDKFIKPSFDVNDLQANLRGAFRYQNHTYGIPKDFSTLALFYNLDMFKNAGLSKPPQSWEELQSFSRKLTKINPKNSQIQVYGLGIAPELARQYFMLKAYGGRLIDSRDYPVFAEDKSLEGLKLIIEQYREQKTSGIPADVGANSTTEMFGQGKSAMVLEGSWAIPFFQETFPNLKFATAEVPRINNQKGTMAYTVAYVMNRKSQHKQAAWELMAYLTGKQGMKAWATKGLVLPSRKSILSEFPAEKQQLYQAFIKGADYATIWQAGVHLPLINTHFNNQFLSALLGEAPLKVALEKAQKAAIKEIKSMDY